MTKRELFCYLAGAIDSDGTIGVKRNTYSMRVVGDSEQPTYSERVALRQVTPAIPTLLKKTFGGSLYMTKPSAKNGKPLVSWAATDKRAVGCIRAVLPFLKVKFAQAKNALALRVVKEKSKQARIACGRGHTGSAHRRPAFGEKMETLYLKAKALNRVGV